MRIAVSGLHLGENCQPGPGVIESLREALGDSIHVIGLAYDALDSGLHCRNLVDEAYLLPYPSVGVDAYLNRLFAIHAECRFDVFIPCLDVELPVLVASTKELGARGVRFVAPTADALARRSKDRLPELAHACRVATPETLTVRDVTSLANAGLRLGFPMVVKGPYYEAEIVYSAAEAILAFHRLSARWGLPLLAQEFVVGEEYNVVALGDGSGDMRGAVSMRKTMLTKLGKAWGGMTILDEDLTDTAARIVRELKWNGGCEIELMRARKNNQIYLIEFNPRFPAWVRLATRAGVNLPLGLLNMALGRAIPIYSVPRSGVWYIRHASEAFGEIADLEAVLSGGRRRPRESNS
ncbi:MAG: ATP-grasp domain-containing protein [Planctomycetes bacterium]|nr:ATP-grasp domain-containing protein [Planctomycetota bacterium]